MMAALGPKNSKAIEEQAWHKVSVHYGARKASTQITTLSQRHGQDQLALLMVFFSDLHTEHRGDAVDEYIRYS